MSDDFDQIETPRERSTYSAFGDDYRGFDPNEGEGGKRGYLVAGLAVGVILVFGAVIWNAYSAGVKSDVSNTPLIRADSDPYKYKPNDAGGVETADQDKRLFDAFEDGEQGGKVIPASAHTESDGEPKDIRPYGSRSEEEIKPPPPVTSSDSYKQAPVIEQPVSKPTPTPTPVPSPTPIRQPEPTLQLPSQTRTDYAINSAGNYLVQLMALRDEQKSAQAWSQMVESYPDIFSGAVMDIQRADLGAKGIYYRLRAAAFPTRDDAVKFCDALKSHGENCIVVSR